MAAGRARAVGELAVVRRRADRAWRRTARRCSPSCRARGAPPAFAPTRDWEAWVERLVALGVTEDYTRIWWDVRPHPKLGTLEVRIPDQPTDVELSAAFAALLQAMCATALDGGLPGGALGDRGVPTTRRTAGRRRASARAANLMHPDGLASCPRPSSAAELLELVRPAARTLGGEALLARLDPARCEADLQLQSATRSRRPRPTLVARTSLA